jgi:hypothetical protein
LVIYERAPDAQNDPLIDVLSALAKARYFQDERSSGLTLFERALAICESTHGVEHFNTGVLLNNVANMVNALGDRARAQALNARSLAICEKALVRSIQSHRMPAIQQPGLIRPKTVKQRQETSALFCFLTEVIRLVEKLK